MVFHVLSQSVHNDRNGSSKNSLNGSIWLAVQTSPHHISSYQKPPDTAKPNSPSERACKNLLKLDVKTLITFWRSCIGLLESVKHDFSGNKNGVYLQVILMSILYKFALVFATFFNIFQWHSKAKCGRQALHWLLRQPGLLQPPLPPVFHGHQWDPSPTPTTKANHSPCGRHGLPHIGRDWIQGHTRTKWKD